MRDLCRLAAVVAFLALTASGATARAQAPARVYRDPGEPVMGVYQSYLGVQPPPGAYPWSYGPAYNPNSLYYHNRLRPVYVSPRRRWFARRR